jgi:hypothetical protein
MGVGPFLPAVIIPLAGEPDHLDGFPRAPLFSRGNTPRETLINLTLIALP